MSYEIRVSLKFKRDLKQLKKRYRKIDADLQSLKKVLLTNPASGTPLGGDIYKIRLPNSSIPTGKSGGFRIITLVKVQKNTVILLTIYSKTEKEDIDHEEIEKIIKELED